MKRDHNEPGGPAPSAEHLEAELQQDRRVADVHRGDELGRRRAEALHTRRLADVAEEARRAELDRVEREESARADAEVARMYRTFRAAGLRTRITSQMARSGEARALGLQRLRALNLKVLVPVLLGFAAWSTTGVHDGAARLTGIGTTDVSNPMWWTLWVLEPVLIGAVVWIIIVRARLAACGGQIAARAVTVLISCLGTSILLNFAGAIPDRTPHGVGQVLAIIGSMIAHGIAPGGAAVTAHLIGIVDESIAGADPWTDNGEPVPLLAQMDLHLPTPPAAISNDGRINDPDDGPQAQIAERRDEPVDEAMPFAESVAAWLADQDPPEGGVTSSPRRPDGDGPQDAAKTRVGADEGSAVRADQIDRDQPRGKTEPASAARRARGLENQRRVAAYMARYPDATVGQIAAALRLSVPTVKRHRRAIRSGE